MKSADVWIAEYGQHGDDWEWIKKIQLDAMREAMRRAAKIAEEWDGNAYMAQHEIQNAIRTAAEQLTEKDLL